MNEVIFSSKSDEWATPQEIFDLLDKEFNFDLDPCATDENHKCETYFTLENSGLEKNWGGEEYSAIRHIPRFPSGWRRHTERPGKTAHSLFC